MTKFIDPITQRNQAQKAVYQEGYDQGQKDTAPAALALAVIAAFSGALMGGGIVGALVAIF